MKKVNNIILVVLLFNLNCKSQNYRQLILDASKTLTSYKTYSVTVNYKLFIDRTFLKPFQERNVAIKKHNGMVFIKQNSGTEVLDGKKYAILLNPKNKTITAREKIKGEDTLNKIEMLDSFFNSDLDSLFEAYKKIDLLKDDLQSCKLKLTFIDNEDLEYTVVVINKVSKMYEQLEMTYKKPIKINQLDGKFHYINLIVKYSDFVPNYDVNLLDFNEGNYILVDKTGQVKAIKKYADYKVNFSEVDYNE